MFAVDECEQAEVDHIPGGAIVIAHKIEGHSHMGMAVVTTQVVL